MTCVSIVMASYNNEVHIEATINSILNQCFKDFELIIIDDGSSDNTINIIQTFNDVRIHLVQQTNMGLTKALIKGCTLAKGEFIARHDADDISFNHRLLKQVKVLQDKPNTSLVSTATRFVSPLNEELYVVNHSKNSPQNFSQKTASKRLVGPPHHGSVMFRTEQYKKVGGYRQQFKVAQDLDLWSRLLELGDHISLNSVEYQATLEENSISALNRNEQLEMERFIIECIEQRKHCGNDKAVIEKLEQRKLGHSLENGSIEDLHSDYNYFIASNLLKKDPKASLKYFQRSIKTKRIQIKAYAKFLLALIKSMTQTNQ